MTAWLFGLVPFILTHHLQPQRGPKCIRYIFPAFRCPVFVSQRLLQPQLSALTCCSPSPSRSGLGYCHQNLFLTILRGSRWLHAHGALLWSFNLALWPTCNKSCETSELLMTSVIFCVFFQHQDKLKRCFYCDYLPIVLTRWSGN